MSYITADILTREIRIEDVEIAGMGTARVMELTRSRQMAFDAWLRPGGELDKDRDKVKDLKLCTLCLVDEAGCLLFEFAEEQMFIDFCAGQENKASGPWTEVNYHVLRVNGYIKEEEETEADELMGK